MLPRKRVLIVDNDEDVLIALERVLEEQGYDTTTAWDLPGVLQLVAGRTAFDLLLIGDHPPELNCERLLKMLQRSAIRIPCVALHTAARHPFSEQYLRYLGASGVACKWDHSQVLEQVERCLAGPPLEAAPPKAMRAAAGR